MYSSNGFKEPQSVMMGEKTNNTLENRDNQILTDHYFA